MATPAGIPSSIGADGIASLLKMRILEGALAGASADSIRAGLFSGRVDLGAIVRRIVEEAPDAARAIFEEAGPGSDRMDPRCLSSDSSFVGRVVQLAIEELLGARSSPELQVMPFPVDDPAAAILREGHNHAVVFHDLPNLTNEIFPIMVDAYVDGLERFGGPRIRAVGVRDDWIGVDGRAGRAIFYDGRTLCEADLSIPIHSVMTLFAGPQEHRCVSERCRALGIPEVNPFTASVVLDDKYECALRWERAGVPTPRSVRVHRGAGAGGVYRELRGWIRDARRRGATGIFVQPNRGTEGRGVRRFEMGSLAEISRFVEGLARDDDVLVREEVGNVMFLDDEGEHACDLRINLAFDGETWRAESGYLRVAPGGDRSGESPGARIVKFSRGALDRLGVRTTGGCVAVCITDDDWSVIIGAARLACEALGGVGLVGLDLKLSAREGVPARGRRRALRILPSVLDANPRPSGLTHSEFLPVGGQVPEPGVTRHLWRGLC